MSHDVRECNRNRKVYYARCPEESELPYNHRHFVLEDAKEPRWGRARPTSPRVARCDLHGPNYPVTVTEPWKDGFVSNDELRNHWTLTEPQPKPS